MKSKALWISRNLAALLCGRAANATAIITIDRVGPNVVATGSGTINFTDLNPFGSNFEPSLINPQEGTLILGPESRSPFDQYCCVTAASSSGLEVSERAA